MMKTCVPPSTRASFLRQNAYLNPSHLCQDRARSGRAHHSLDTDYPKKEGKSGTSSETYNRGNRSFPQYALHLTQHPMKPDPKKILHPNTRDRQHESIKIFKISISMMSDERRMSYRESV